MIAAACLAVAACGGGGHHSAPAGTGVYSFGDVGTGYKLRALEHLTPTPVPGIRGRVIQVATSNSDGYAVTSAGAVYAWGAGSNGELGDGSRPTFAATAVRVRFPSGVRIVSLPNPMPFDGALAIDSSGHAWGWGLNASHDLCLPGRTEPVPRRIPLGEVTLGAGARSHSLLVSDGRLYACGSGRDGVLGDGSMHSSARPVAVRGLPSGVRISSVTASWEGSGALLGNGAYYDWGYNTAGQLGDGTTSDSAVPVHVPLPGPVRQVFQGGSWVRNGQTLAILADGSVWGWGVGTRGQLGDGQTTDSTLPIRIAPPAGVNFQQVISGGYASYAIDTHGRLWVWGANFFGELGIGNGPLIVRHPVDLGLHLRQVSATSTNVVALAG
jgi:alpha-tubulin suppressor-like RCC1 family protein